MFQQTDALLIKEKKKLHTDVEQVLDNIWSIGGERGWYYGDWLWHLRGFLDKLVGGVGLRRGRTNKTRNSYRRYT